MYTRPSQPKGPLGFVVPPWYTNHAMSILLIDGENFRNKIKAVFEHAQKSHPNWHQYDFKGLLHQVLRGMEIERIVFYFARIKEHRDTKEKSQRLIQEQRLLKTHLERQGFEVILSGRVRGHLENSHKDKPVLVFKEKGVDVKIAVDMVSMACDKKTTEIVLGSSDSDLQPAIEEATRRGIDCVYLGFELNPNKGISYTTKRTILIRNAEVIEFEEEQPRLIAA